MPTRSHAPKPAKRSRPEAPRHTLIDIWQQGYETILAEYIARRDRLPLLKRLDELLWSFHFVHEQLPCNPKTAAQLEENHGDGLLDKRRELQASALVFYDSASESVRSSTIRKICEIGEQARDARRRFEVTNALLPKARDWGNDTEAIRKFVQQGRHVAEIIEQRTRGRVDDPAGRLRCVLKELRGYADAGDLMLPPFDYRHDRAGRHDSPWIKTALRQLQALKLHPPSREFQFRDFCDYLLIAWCLKPYKED